MEDRKATADVQEAPALLRSLADFLEHHRLTDQSKFAFGEGGYLSISTDSHDEINRWAQALGVQIDRQEVTNGGGKPFVAYSVRGLLSGHPRGFSVMYADYDEAKLLAAEAERSALSDAEDEAWLESKPEPVA